MNQKLPPPMPKGNGNKLADAVYGPKDTKDRFAIVSGRKLGPQRVVLYGPGGIGKSTLASLAPTPVFLDLEGGTGQMDVPRVDGIETWDDLRTCLQSSALDDYQTIVIDSATRAEEMALPHTLATVRTERGEAAESIEGYGYGKGYQHLYDTFLRLLQDCDSQIRRGRNIVLIAHDCINDVPNPSGENFLRFEPHLQAPKSGKASIRNRVVQWADHVLFVSYDVVVKDGKGRGAGTRTIWPVERPDHLANSRSLTDPIPYESADDGTVWSLMLGGAQ